VDILDVEEINKTINTIFFCHSFKQDLRLKMGLVLDREITENNPAVGNDEQKTKSDDESFEIDQVLDNHPR